MLSEEANRDCGEGGGDFKKGPGWGGGPRSEGQVSESRLNAVRGEVRDPGEDLGVRSLQKHRKRFLRNVK